jgi:hypothetical protein
MQIVEVGLLGVRTSVIVFQHRSKSLRFVLIPVAHMGRPDYYRRIADRLAVCQLIVAEGYDGPSSTGLAYTIALRLSRQRHGGELVHQDIDYEALGVPTVWPDGVRRGRHQRLGLWGWLDLVLMVPFLTIAMAAGGRNWLLRRNFEINDDTKPRMRWSLMQKVVLEERDADLIAALTRIHEQHDGEPVDVGVIYGAAHFPAVVQALTDGLGYRTQGRGEWLTAIDLAF